MKTLRMISTVVVWAALTLLAHAAETTPGADSVKTGTRGTTDDMVLDVPLRDPSICLGPDGTYYLTGTTGTRMDSPHQASGAKHQAQDVDFHNNDGVRLWSSKDLKNWKDEGFAWNFSTDIELKGDGGIIGSNYQREMYPIPGMTPGARGCAATAPRLNFDGVRFWLTYSINGYAAGAAPAKGAKPKGEWIDTRLIVEAGGAETGRSDASLFVDRDGTPYLVWGGGMIAKLKSPEELTQLKHGDVGVEEPRRYLPTLIDGYFVDDFLPEHGAPYGVSVFFKDNRYHFLFSATTYRDGHIHEDSYICSADTLFGTYSQPKPFILDSGRCAVFVDADGNYRVSYSSPQGQVVIADFPEPNAPAPFQSPSAARAEIATRIPVPEPSDKPADVPQLLEMIEPLMDHPLRDAALCFGPEGTAYLVGTEASWKANPDNERTLDWSNNNGIRLWRSEDLKSWKDMGYVWDADKDGSDWHQSVHLDLTCGAEPRIGRAITAPEMHYLKGTFWIVYSMNGSGIGLMKSKSGKAEGPYENLGRIVKNGRDGSLFQDGEDVFLVWGQGFKAKLNDDLTALAGPVEALFTKVAWYPRAMRRLEVMGQWGSRLIKAGDWYIWTFTTRSGRLGNNSIDTLASWSKSLDGPWGEPCLMLANGGQSTLVAGEEGKYFATVSGEDEYAHLPYLPAITEVIVNPQAYNPRGLIAAQFQAVNSVRATSLDLWKGHPDLVPHFLRDVWMGYIDGYYYVTGSFWNVDEWANIVPLYRSKDMVHWEPLPDAVHGPGAIMKIEDFFQHPEWDMERYASFIAKSRSKRTELFDIKLKKHDGKYYSEIMILGMPAFLSVADKIGGPYKPLRTIPVSCDIIEDEDGSMVYAHVEWTKRYADMEALINETKAENREGRLPFRHERGLQCLEDSETGILKIDGTYVKYSTDWTGSYDLNYTLSKTIEGPWRHLRVLPYGGNGYLFQDKDGRWWCAHFMNSNDSATRQQNFVRLNIYPVHVEWQGDELIMEPEAVRTSRARLEKLGALWQSPHTNVQSK